MRPITPIVKYLLITNALVFVMIQVMGENSELAGDLMLFYPTTTWFKPWQLITHAFMHADVSHIAFNMLGLYFFGPVIESRLGGQRFLILYIAALIGAVALHFGSIWWSTQGLETAMEAFIADPSLSTFNGYWKGLDLNGQVHAIRDGSGRIIGREFYTTVVGEVQDALALEDPQSIDQMIAGGKMLMADYIEDRTNIPMLGASGAVSGVFASFAVFYPKQKVYPMFLPFGFAAWIMVLVVFGVDLVLGVLNITGDNIAHWAHLGGAIAGALVAYYFARTTVPPHIRRIN